MASSPIYCTSLSCWQLPMHLCKRHNTCLQLLCGIEDNCVPKCANFNKRSVSRGVFAESSPALPITHMECLE